MSERHSQLSASDVRRDVKIFLSAVTDEFEPKQGENRVLYRSRLRTICDKPNVTVKIQEDFQAGGVPTLDKLDDYIQQCDAVVQLVGDMTGAMAEPVVVESLQRRYPELADRLRTLIETPGG